VHVRLQRKFRVHVRFSSGCSACTPVSLSDAPCARTLLRRMFRMLEGLSELHDDVFMRLTFAAIGDQFHVAQIVRIRIRICCDPSYILVK